MKRRITKLAAVLLASVLLMALAAPMASAAIAGPSAPTFSTVMRHTPKTLFPVPGTAILTVTDEETGLPVAGAKYDLYRTGLCGGPDSKIGTYTTDKDGRITVGHASTGTFCWVAASEVEGYAADAARHPFTIWGNQFTETAVALAKPEPEPEIEEVPAAETEEDGYLAINPAKIVELIDFVLANGVYMEAETSYYLLNACYPLTDELVMNLDVVVYVDENGAPFSIAIGHYPSIEGSNTYVTMSLLSLSAVPEKTMLYWDEENIEYVMNVDGSKFAYTLDPSAFVFSVYYEDLDITRDDEGEVDVDKSSEIIFELKKLLRDFNTVMAFWGLDITVDDIGFPFHNFESRFTLVLGENADEIVPLTEEDPLFEVFSSLFGY